MDVGKINQIDGGAGNDVLVGLGGDDIYRFGLGNGVDTVIEQGSSGFDTICLGPASPCRT